MYVHPYVFFGGWVHRRERVLARVYPYLPSMPRAGAILSAAFLAPPHLSTLFHKGTISEKSY